MSTKTAVISCGVLYGEVTEILRGTDYRVEFLPQGLHDKPDCAMMRTRIQDKIDELESSKSYDRIILAYGNCGGGVDGISTNSAELMIPRIHDCIPLLAGNDKLEGNIAEPGSYYLSRGWIDCSSDSYKEFLFFTNELEKWREKFLEYRRNQGEYPIGNDLGWWMEKDRLDPGKRDREKFSRKMINKITAQCVGNYRKLVLLESELLESIHYDYAKEMFEFLAELLEDARGINLEYRKLNSSFDLLNETLMNPETSPLVHIEQPNSPLKSDILV